MFVETFFQKKIKVISKKTIKFFLKELVATFFPSRFFTQVLMFSRLVIFLKRKRCGIPHTDRSKKQETQNRV